MSKKVLKEDVKLEELSAEEQAEVMHKLADSYQPEPVKKGLFKNRTDKAHLAVSLVKSLLRIMAGYYLLQLDMPMAGWYLIAAEGLGIVEELVV